MTDGMTQVTAAPAARLASAEAAGRLARYGTFGVGSGVHIMVHPLLELVREIAERAQTATQEQPG
jgi:hypothetical protein